MKIKGASTTALQVVTQFTQNPRQTQRSNTLDNRVTTPRPMATNPALNNNCYNDDPCCDAWARQGECQQNSVYMNRYCRRSCRLCMNPSDSRGGTNITTIIYKYQAVMTDTSPALSGADKITALVGDSGWQKIVKHLVAGVT
uniref:ShKT domain-containing protein n=1 Tax=Heterorhabditis bacteriophora TaxID=37862 RepID=A0A1I7WR93_HETBA